MNVGALTRRLGILLVCFLSIAAVRSPVARAAGAPTAEDEQRARDLYARAEKSFDVGKFAEALTDYQAAYEAKPLPGFLFNIAQCYRNMGNYERARFFFRRYLTVEPHAPNHRRVEELISEMTKKIDAQGAAPATTPTTPPPVDAKPAESKLGDTEVKPPPAEAKAPEPATAPPAAEAPPLPSAPPPAAADSSVPVVTATSPSPEESHPVYTRWWFWTGVTAVVVGGAVAAFFLTRPQTKTPGSLDPIDGR
jgi:hypothetical protein